MAKLKLTDEQLDQIQVATGWSRNELYLVFKHLPKGKAIGRKEIISASNEAGLGSTEEKATALLGIIGGADGPTAIYL